MDITVVVALLAGVSGAVTGIGALVVNRRDAQTRADTSYVDRNLAAMQAIVDAQIAENVRLHERLETETARLQTALEACEGRCDECLKRIKMLERRRHNS